MLNEAHLQFEQTDIVENGCCSIIVRVLNDGRDSGTLFKGWSIILTRFAIFVVTAKAQIFILKLRLFSDFRDILS